MINDRIGVGVIGASLKWGWGANTTIPALKLLPDYEVRALSTTKSDTAAAAAAALDVPLAFTDNRELVSRPEIDLVVITVKVPEHLALVKLAIAAGKHVYCEWPLGNGLAEAIEMAELAHGAGVRGFTGLHGRQAPVVAYLRELLAERAIGEVLSTSLVGSGMGWGPEILQSVAYTADAKNGATLLTIGLGHTVDALCHCLGEFDSLTATMTQRRQTLRIVETGEPLPLKVPDQIAVGGLLQGGAAASIHYRAGTSRGTNLLWEINGTEGDIRITSDGGAVQAFEARIEIGCGEDQQVVPVEIPARFRWVPADMPGGFIYNIGQAYARLARDLKDGTSHCATFDDGVARHRMLDAISASAETGQRQHYSRS